MTYKEIPLTNSQLKVKVSPEDYEYLIRWSWRLTKGGYVKRSTRVNGKTKDFLLHRVIMSAPTGVDIDHCDRDKLNSTRENLRFSDKAGNARNRGPIKNNLTGMKGVKQNYRKNGQVYFSALINKQDIEYYLGSYFNLEDAARAYNIKALELFGDFASLNNIIDPLKAPKKSITLRGKNQKYVGVTFRPDIKRYLARIKFNKKETYIGLFNTEIEAAQAYNKKAIELKGEKARLNPL